jgi:O-antigen/teichoic acid export membrane protein
MAIAWALAGVMPFALIREFGRQYAFARLQIAQALILDIAVAAIQLAALVWLGSSGRMSAATACAALAVACGVTTLGWLYLARADFRIGLGHARATIARSWDLGKWLLAGHMTALVQGYVIYWLSIAITGAAVTGVYAACMSIVAFANPLMIGFHNTSTPRSVLAWKNGGGQSLLRHAVRDTLILGAMMAAFCIVILLAGGHIMRALYHGGEFEEHAHTLMVLALATLAMAIGAPASNALATMERPRAIVAVGLIVTVVTVALVWWLMTEWGLLGAAYGALVGNVVGAIGRWGALLAIVPRACDSAPLNRGRACWCRRSPRPCR